MQDEINGCPWQPNLQLQTIGGDCCWRNQNWLIRIKHLLQCSAMVNRTSESNCCSVHGYTRHNFVLSSASLLVFDVLALLPLLHFLHFHYHLLTSSHNQITHGSRSSNFFNLVQMIKNFSNKRVEEITAL